MFERTTSIVSRGGRVFRHRLSGAILAMLFMLVAVPLLAIKIDAPVVDRAGILTQKEEQELGQRLRAHQERTGVQMAILLVDTTGDEPIEDFSFKVARRWGGGSDERDDGILLTLAVEDRRSRLELGYGIEGHISDGRAARIMRSMRPMLRDEQYAAALHLAVDQVIDRTDDFVVGEPIPPPPIVDRLGGALGMGAAGALLGGFLLVFAARTVWRRRGEELPVGRDGWVGLTFGTAVALGAGLSALTWDLAGPGYGVALLYGTVGGGVLLISSPAGSVAVGGMFGLLSLALLLDGTDAIRAFGDGAGGGIANLCLIHMVPTCFLWAAASEKLGGGGSSGGSTYSSSGYSSSSSSSSSSYSGGGGSFGGGGASSSW